jgi:putative transposase
VNKLSSAERANILRVVNSDRFVDLVPIQIFATLLDEDTYLCSTSTIYRVLDEYSQVKERRRLARHRARVVEFVKVFEASGC